MKFSFFVVIHMGDVEYVVRRVERILGRRVDCYARIKEDQLLVTMCDGSSYIVVFSVSRFKPVSIAALNKEGKIIGFVY